MLDDELYFSGQALIGNDFTIDEVAQWFADEKEASVGLRGADYKYEYHALNSLHGWKYLPERTFDEVLSYGGGTGAELLPIAGRLRAVTILEPTRNFIPQISATYAAPGVDGSFPFPDETFDLVTCLNVLHHIPRVSFALNEMFRVLKPGGFAVLNEPVISMGDWRCKREGLTPRERGIPIHLFQRFIAQSNFQIVHQSRCCFAPLVRFSTLTNVSVYNFRSVTMLDAVLSALPIWSSQYHATSFIQKVRAVSAFFVITRSGA